MDGNLPTWLRRFELTISDHNENGLFNSTDFDINDIRFLDKLGGTIGTDIMIRNKIYEITDMHIYTDIRNNTLGSKDGYHFQLDIIVQEKAGQ